MIQTEKMRRSVMFSLAIGGVVAVAVVGQSMVHAEPATSNDTRVFELRTYTAAEGKLEDLKARFRNHTVKLFEKHGITNIGYWTPVEGPEAENTLVYLLAHDSREAAKASFAAFGKDPEWQEARKASEANGKLTTKIESVFLSPTDFSQLK